MGRRRTTQVEENPDLPTGVEIHNKTLRIVFPYKRQRCRETLGLVPTKKNIDYAAGLRATVLHEIKTQTFDYAKRFPESKNASRFSESSSVIVHVTLDQAKQEFLAYRSLDIAYTTLEGLTSAMNVIIPVLGDEKTLASTLIPSDISDARIDLSRNRKNSTVNNRLDIMRSFFKFLKLRNYTKHDLSSECRHLPDVNKEDIPDPLEEEELLKLVEVCHYDFHKHLFTVACWTGLRAGELLSLSWSDVDLKNNLLHVRRSYSKYGFKLPKTYKTRSIDLLPPAVEAFKKMRLLTGLLPVISVDVMQRDKKVTKKETLRLVFNRHCILSPSLHSTSKPYMSVKSLGRRWTALLKKAGIRHRRLHQSRHTYACWLLAASGNPAYVAEQLGHKNTKMVLEVYSKWMPSRSSGESQRIWQMMENLKRESHEEGSGSAGNSS